MVWLQRREFITLLGGATAAYRSDPRAQQQGVKDAGIPDVSLRRAWVS
jgi:hypothetical protein